MAQESKSKPSESVPAPKAAVPTDAVTKLVDEHHLASLGITKEVAMRMLASKGSDDFLNTKVTTRVFLVHQANSAEEIMQAQRNAGIMGKDPSIDARTRCACLDVVAKCGIALARLGEVAISIARSLDAPEDQAKGLLVQPMQNNFFGFPPVANTRVQSANNGNSTAIDVVPLVKSS